MDDSLDSFSRIAEFHLKNGTTSFIGSTITAPLNKIESILKKGDLFKASNKVKSLHAKESSFLGFHLEGPWISPKNPGAQDLSYIIPPDKRSIELIKKYSESILMVTFMEFFQVIPIHRVCGGLLIGVIPGKLNFGAIT